MTPTQMIIAAINEAELSEADCQLIRDAVRVKWKIHQEIRKARAINEMKYTYGVGTRVRTIGLRPSYANGKLGTIKKIRTSKAEVELDEPIGRRFGQNRLLVIPITGLEVVELSPAKQAAPLMNFVTNR